MEGDVRLDYTKEQQYTLEILSTRLESKIIRIVCHINIKRDFNNDICLSWRIKKSFTPTLKYSYGYLTITYRKLVSSKLDDMKMFNKK